MTLDLQTDQLPTFDSPPVVETVLSAQFDPIANMRTVHFGLFWQRMRDRFPGTDEKTAIEPIFEQFDQTTKRPSRLHFEVREEFKLGRLWLLNELGTEMIQLQSDRFIKNWRKVETGEHYPRYQRVIKPAFLEDFEAFKDFIHEEKLGSIAVNQCEVTYVNHIVAGEGWTSWSDARKVFSFLSPESDGIEDAAFMLRYPIVNEGKQVGRLQVDIQAAVREKDNIPMYVMTLTARGMVGKGVDFFDLGRQAVVNSFAQLTTPEMHKIWRRTQ